MIQVTVSDENGVVQLINFKSQPEADAWVNEMPKHPEWYPPGKKYSLASADITQQIADKKQTMDNASAMIIGFDKTKITTLAGALNLIEALLYKMGMK